MDWPTAAMVIAFCATGVAFVWAFVWMVVRSEGRGVELPPDSGPTWTSKTTTRRESPGEEAGR